MKKAFYFLVGSVCLAALIEQDPARTAAQPPGPTAYEITGKVVDSESGKGLENITVRVTPKGEAPLASVQTGKDGRYSVKVPTTNDFVDVIDYSGGGRNGYEEKIWVKEKNVINKSLSLPT